MAGVAPLQSLTGLVVRYDDQPQATPEQRMGNAVDERHGSWGEQGAPYPWQSSLGMGGTHGPYGPENQLLGDANDVWFPGGMLTDPSDLDLTPSTRAAPFPKGVASGPVPGANPDDIAEQLRQSALIHGVKTNAGIRSLTSPQGEVQNDDWQELWEVNPGGTDQVDIPAQMKSSGFMWGTRDRVQSFAAQNGFGFDSKHMHRRYATGSIPGNTMWLKPGGRPMVKHAAGTARPAIGDSSPFYGDDTGAAFGVQGAVLSTQPTVYVPPPEPYLASAQPFSDDPAPPEWY